MAKKTRTSVIYLDGRGNKYARVDTDWVGRKPHTVLVRQIPGARKGTKSYWVCNTVAGEGSTAARLHRTTREVMAWAVKGRRATEPGQVAWSKVPKRMRDILDRSSAGMRK